MSEVVAKEQYDTFVLALSLCTGQWRGEESVMSENGVRSPISGSRRTYRSSSRGRRREGRTETDPDRPVESKERG